jgi:hypothetical protein
MTRVAIRSHVYRNNIPSKKEHGQIYYSKLHFDLSKNSAEESKAEYYTVKEAMEKFKLSRDSVYNILAVPPDSQREERTLRPLPESGF